MYGRLQISGGGRNCMVCEIFPSWLQGSEVTLDFPNLNSYSMSCGKRSSLPVVPFMFSIRQYVSARG